MPKKLLKRPAVAAKLGICTKTVAKLVHEGRLPAPIQLPGISTWFWEETEIDKLVDGLIEARDSEAA